MYSDGTADSCNIAFGAPLVAANSHNSYQRSTCKQYGQTLAAIAGLNLHNVMLFSAAGGNAKLLHTSAVGIQQFGNKQCKGFWFGTELVMANKLLISYTCKNNITSDNATITPRDVLPESNQNNHRSKKRNNEHKAIFRSQQRLWHKKLSELTTVLRRAGIKASVAEFLRDPAKYAGKVTIKTQTRLASFPMRQGTIDNIGNFGAGFGDYLSLGLAAVIRRRARIKAEQHSQAYKSGEYTAMALQVTARAL